LCSCQHRVAKVHQPLPHIQQFQYIVNAKPVVGFIRMLHRQALPFRKAPAQLIRLRLPARRVVADCPVDTYQAHTSTQSSSFAEYRNSSPGNFSASLAGDSAHH